jgi:L-asparaginase / beta-aspartyl-peptidase
MWALAVHGGAKRIDRHEEEAHVQGCLAAMACGQKMLESNAGALDAAEAAVRVLEDDPIFNAGIGSAANADGEVEMDAAIMDGATHNVGAVAAIRGVRNPIAVARLLVPEKEILLVSEGARRFALEKRVELHEPRDPRHRSGKKGRDTVGCVALDAHGNFAVATSTGGIEKSRPGRVGDSPLPGCGFYAENKLGAVALTGEGEYIARFMLAARVMHALRGADPQRAIDAALDAMKLIGGEAGGIVLGPDGAFGCAHNTPHMAFASVSSGNPPCAAIRRDA